MASQHWEYTYQVVTLVEDDLLGSFAKLNTLGKIGWELMGLYPAPMKDDGNYVAVLKKSKGPLSL